MARNLLNEGDHTTTRNLVSEFGSAEANTECMEYDTLELMSEDGMHNLLMARQICEEQEAQAARKTRQHRAVELQPPGGDQDFWATMSKMMDFQSNNIHTGITMGMNRLENELETKLQREREECREELQQFYIGQEKVEQRLGDDIREVRMKAQNFDDLFKNETRERQEDSRLLDSKFEGVVDNIAMSETEGIPATTSSGSTSATTAAAA